MRQIKIVSDGIAFNTHVYDQDGKEIQGISKVEISVEACGLVNAKLSFCNVALEIFALSEVPTHEREDGTPI